jgi:hypothetical protein
MNPTNIPEINFEALMVACTACLTTMSSDSLGLALNNQFLILQVTEDAEIISLERYFSEDVDSNEALLTNSKNYNEYVNNPYYPQLDAYIAFINRVQDLADANPDFLQELGLNNWELVTIEDSVDDSISDNGEEEVEYYAELLSDLVGQTIISNGQSCLKVFAEKYATQCFYDKVNKCVQFNSNSHEFDIFSKIDADTSDCVFYATAFTEYNNPTNSVITTNSYDTIEDCLDSLKRMLVREKAQSEILPTI